MAENLGKASLELEADGRGLDKDLRRWEGATRKFGGVFGTVAKAAGVAMVALGTGALVAGKKMVDLASDAGEVDSKLQVVFGRTLPGLTKELDTFSRATGASRFELRQQAADMGALLEPLLGTKAAAADMSVEFVKLATDLGSFNNVPVADALLAIRSGLVGEAEPLRAFGVLLNEAAVSAEGLRLGLVKKGETMTEQEKVQARASLIMQQTSLAQGDATRTAGSMANQMKALTNNVRDAATELGINLIPIALAVVSTFNTHWPTIERIAGAVMGAVVGGIRAAVGFVRDHWPTIVTVFETVRGGVEVAMRGTRAAFDTIAPVVREAWGSARAAGQRYIDWHRGELQPALDNVLAAGRSSWQRFGGDVNSTARTDLGVLGTLVRFNMNQVKNIIEIALAVIRGDWAQAWDSFKSIGSNALNTARGLIQGGISNFKAAAHALGTAIVTGHREGMVPLAQAVAEKLRAIPGALADAAGAAFNAAVSIGRQIISGVVSGLGGLLESVKDKIVGGVRGAISAAGGLLHGSGPYQITKPLVGVPLGEGVVSGFLLGSADLPAKMSEKVRAGLTAARQTIMDARSEMAAAFSELASAGTEALGKQGEALTKSEAKLARMEAKRQAQEIADRIREAQAALDAAQRGTLQGDVIIVDEEAVKAARKALDDALYEQTRANLERQAAIEREKRDEQTALRQRHFQERLTSLQAALAAEGATHQEAHARVVKLFKAFGIDYRNSGRHLGASLAEGILDSLDVVAAAAAEIARVIAKYLRLKSPAELGPLSTIDSWWRPLGGELLAAALSGSAEIGRALTAAMESSIRLPALPAVAGVGAVPASRATGGITINFPNYVGSRDELVREVRSGLLKLQNGQGSTGLR